MIPPKKGNLVQKGYIGAGEEKEAKKKKKRRSNKCVCKSNECLIYKIIKIIYCEI